MLPGSVRRLLLYWWIRSFHPEAKAWTAAVLEPGRPVSTRTRAIALAFPSLGLLWQTDAEIRTEPLEEAIALFRSTGDAFSEGLALTVASLAFMSVEPPDLVGQSRDPRHLIRARLSNTLDPRRLENGGRRP